MSEYKGYLIDKLLSTLIDFNNMTDQCVFMNLSGHIGKIDVEICKSKKEYNEKSQLHLSLYDLLKAQGIAAALNRDIFEFPTKLDTKIYSDDEIEEIILTTNSLIDILELYIEQRHGDTVESFNAVKDDLTNRNILKL